MEVQANGNAGASRLDVARGVGMMGSEAALRKILLTVTGSMVADLPKIDAALQAGDVPTANRLLHAIKGYTPIFASDALVMQVTEVEKLSKTESAAVVQAQYAPLGVELKGLVVEIQAFLSGT